MAAITCWNVKSVSGGREPVQPRAACEHPAAPDDGVRLQAGLAEQVARRRGA